MIQWTEILISAGVAVVVAVAIRVVRARRAERNRPPAHIHGALMQRAEACADKSAFLRKVCREFKANGHISNRQAEAVKKAIARIEARAGVHQAM
jgi:hypothetical protein